MDFDNIIGGRIREKREEKGLRQDDLAEKTNLSTNFISKIERGVRQPRLDKLVRIINALDASADEILQDVLTNDYTARLAKYTEKIGKLTKEDQDKILAEIEALLKDK